MRSWEYESHLRSKKYFRFKEMVLRLRGRRCERCGVGGMLDIHHKHYRTLGMERPMDVQVLCRHCHERVHHFRQTQHCDNLGPRGRRQ
jgi:5-methylcytosine-specific restriction endonuclease McrA